MDIAAKWPEIARNHATARNESVDLLRVLSAFGIVWYHSQYPPGHFVGYAGLIVFLMLGAYFEVSRTAGASYWGTAKRYLIPWLFWSVFYGVVNFVQHDPVFGPDPLRTLLSGTAPHLWFLPFMCATIFVIRSLRGRIAVPALFAAGVLLVTASAWRLAAESAGPPFAQWGHAIPPVLFGVLLGQREEIWRMLAAATIGACWALWSLAGVGEPYFLGGLAVVVALNANIRWRFSALAPFMMGTYLMHPVFLSAGARAGLHGPVQITAAFFGALAAAVVARQFAIGRLITA